MSLQEMFDGEGIQWFKAEEFLTLGGSHSNEDSDGYGLNSEPPRELWGGIVQLAKVWDRVRNEVGEPIIMNSVYRDPDYNEAIGGAPQSYHKLGLAGDGSGPPVSVLFKAAHKLRNSGVFMGGIGAYNTFVHIDIRGTKADWDNRS